jgi:hypothetical protein
MSPEEMRKRVYLYFLLLVSGLFFVVPGLEHPYWHDEVYTLIKFSDTWQHALFDYHLPNNHQLFSLLFWAYRQILPETSIFTYAVVRLLPLTIFLTALVLLAVLAQRRGGQLAALFAGMLFITAHITLNFATELRGYALSWIFALAAFHFLSAYLTAGEKKSGRRNLIFYLLSCWMLGGILPTNLLIPAALAVWALSEIYLQNGVPAVRHRLKEWLLIAFAPLAGLLILVLVYAQLAESITASAAATRSFMAWHYPLAVFRDLLFLAPVFAGAALSHRPALGQSVSTFSAPRFTLIVFVVPWVLCLLLPRVPNDRILVTVAPLIFLGLGIWLSESSRKLFGVTARRLTIISATLCAILIATAYQREQQPLAWRLSAINDSANVENVHDLYDQWYNQNDTIREAGKMSADLTKTQHAVVVFAADDAFAWGFYFLHYFPHDTNGDGGWYERIIAEPLALAEYRELVKKQPLVIVALNHATAATVAQNLLPITANQASAHSLQLRVLATVGRFYFFTVDNVFAGGAGR